MSEKLQCFHRIDELEKVSIVRLKGHIDHTAIPLIEEHIKSNRKKGLRIDKNVIVDYALVDKVDSSAVAFHLVKLKEYEAEGFKIGFMNASEELMFFLSMFKLSDDFKIYTSEEEAIKELNQ